MEVVPMCSPASHVAECLLGHLTSYSKQIPCVEWSDIKNTIFNKTVLFSNECTFSSYENT